jgi:outer membrane receptor for ferrienterochelin and colicin
MLMKNLAIMSGLLICPSIKAAPCTNITKIVDKSIEELMDIRVSSSNKTATCISQAPNTISSYNYKEIRNLGARTLSDVLTLVAGVQMQTIPNGRHRLWIRGVQSEFNNKVALYIDNVPIKDAFGGFAIDEGLPVESIEKVEIIRGPGSALYGSNAFSGVINIFTFQAGKKTSNGTKSDKKLENTLKLGIGENNTHLAYATVEQNIANAVDVKLEGKWLETDGRKPDYNRIG